MLVTTLHLIGLSVAFGSSLATPLAVHSSMEGSAEEEEEPLHLSPTPSPPSTIGPASEHPTTPIGPSHMDRVFLDQVVDFMEENLLLICVGSTLFVLILLIVCGSIFMSRRRKVNAYYPSSFPSKMYVDEKDKTGGIKPFNELPEKAANTQPTRQTDSGKQLQADIMRAAKKLRTPTKPPSGERGPSSAVDQSPEEREPSSAADQSLEVGEREPSSAADQSPEVGEREPSSAADQSPEEREPSSAADQSPEIGERELGPAADQSPEEHATILDTTREGEELCQVSCSETAAGTSDPEEPVTPLEPEPVSAGLEQDESTQSPSGPGSSQTPQDLGPPTQSHHSDSTATPPLITGEKTAF